MRLVASSATLSPPSSANSLPYTNNFSTLDGNGESTAAFTLPSGLNPAFIGVTLNHSYITIVGGTAVDMASNPVPVQLVP